MLNSLWISTSQGQQKFSKSTEATGAVQCPEAADAVDTYDCSDDRAPAAQLKGSITNHSTIDLKLT
jgi:hypothetical protein